MGADSVPWSRLTITLALARSPPSTTTAHGLGPLLLSAYTIRVTYRFDPKHYKLKCLPMRVIFDAGSSNGGTI